VHIPLDNINSDSSPEYVSRIAQRFGGMITIADDLDQF